MRLGLASSLFLPDTAYADFRTSANLIQKRITPLAILSAEDQPIVNAQQEAITAKGRQSLSVCRVIALAEDFKQVLFVQLLEKLPELLGDRATVALYAEHAKAIERFLKYSLEKEGLRFSDNVFNALYLDFFCDLSSRSPRTNSDSISET